MIMGVIMKLLYILMLTGFLLLGAAENLMARGPLNPVFEDSVYEVEPVRTRRTAKFAISLPVQKNAGFDWKYVPEGDNAKYVKPLENYYRQDDALMRGRSGFRHFIFRALRAGKPVLHFVQQYKLDKNVADELFIKTKISDQSR